MAPAAPSANYNLAMAKERVNNSKVKGLLYGGSADRPETPKHEGKRRVAHALGHGTPYATTNEQPAAPPAASPKESHATKPKPKEGASKIGSSPLAHMQAAPEEEDHGSHTRRPKPKEGAQKIGGSFDPNVYLQNRASNQQNMANMKARAWGSNNLLGHAEAAPQQGQQGPLSPSAAQQEEDEEEQRRLQQQQQAYYGGGYGQ